MTNYKRVRNTLWAFGPHYKACMRPVTDHDLVEVDGKLTLVTTCGWEVKIYGYLDKREVTRFADVRQAYNHLRFLVYDYEEDYKVWGRMLP